MFGEPFSKKAGLMMRLDVDYGDEVEESSVEPGSKTALDKPVQVRSKEMGSRCEAPAPPVWYRDRDLTGVGGNAPDHNGLLMQLDKMPLVANRGNTR